jgi:hypothetical protein
MTEIEKQEQPKQDPKIALAKLKQLLGSRKFWGVVAALVIVIVKAYKPDFPISEEQLSNLLYVIIAYIMGTAIEDGMRSAMTSGV